MPRRLGRLARQQPVELGQARLPAGGVAGGLDALAQEMREQQPAAVAGRFELEAQLLAAPVEGEQPRRVELRDLALASLARRGRRT